MSGKQFGPSRGSSSVGNRLTDRYANTGPDEPDTAPARTPKKPAMVTRSWYLPAETADRLGQAADQLWREIPGTSKHEVLAALIEAGLAQIDDVRTQLSQHSHDSQT